MKLKQGKWDGVHYAHNLSNTMCPEYLIHFHEDYEIYYYVKGDVTYLVNGKPVTLKPHCMLLLSPGTYHGLRINSQADYERYAIHFNANNVNVKYASVLLSPFYNHPENSFKVYDNCLSAGILNDIENIIHCTTTDNFKNEMEFNIRLHTLLYTILNSTEEENQETTADKNCVANKLMQYINDNFTQEINLRILSEQFFLSKNYLNKLFKEYTGNTIMDYTIKKRLTSAQTMILAGTSPTLACALCGFNDYSSFFKAYKNYYGCSPSRK